MIQGMINQMKARVTLCITVILLSAFAAGCALRPAAAPRSSQEAPAEPVYTPVPVEESIAETQTMEYTVEYHLGDVILFSETVIENDFPRAVPTVEGVLLTGWETASGESADPATTPVTENTVYYAQTLPLTKAIHGYLFPDEKG